MSENSSEQGTDRPVGSHLSCCFTPARLCGGSLNFSGVVFLSLDGGWDQTSELPALKHSDSTPGLCTLRLHAQFYPLLQVPLLLRPGPKLLWYSHLSSDF